MTDHALTFAVAQAEGMQPFIAGSKVYKSRAYKYEQLFCPLHLARDAAPIIRRERIVLTRLASGLWRARKGRRVRTDQRAYVAAMRVYTGAR